MTNLCNGLKTLREECDKTKMKIYDYSFEIVSENDILHEFYLTLKKIMVDIDARVLLSPSWSHVVTSLVATKAFQTGELSLVWAIDLQLPIYVPISHAENIICSVIKPENTELSTDHIIIKHKNGTLITPKPIPYLVLKQTSVVHKVEISNIECRPLITNEQYMHFVPWKYIRAATVDEYKMNETNAHGKIFVRPVYCKDPEEGNTATFKFTIQTMMPIGYHLELLYDYLENEIIMMIKLLSENAQYKTKMFDCELPSLTRHLVQIALFKNSLPLFKLHARFGVITVTELDTSEKNKEKIAAIVKYLHTSLLPMLRREFDNFVAFIKEL